MLISHCICWSSKTCRFVYHVNPKSINNKRRKGGKATNTINKSVKSRESYKRQSRARLAAYYRLLSVHNRWTARQARLSIWLTHCRFTPPPHTTPKPDRFTKDTGFVCFLPILIPWRVFSVWLFTPLWPATEPRGWFLKIGRCFWNEIGLILSKRRVSLLWVWFEGGFLQIEKSKRNCRYYTCDPLFFQN